MRLHLESCKQAKKRIQIFGSGPEEIHEDDQRAVAPLLQSTSEGDDLVQSEEEKPLGKPHGGLLVLRQNL